MAEDVPGGDVKDSGIFFSLRNLVEVDSQRAAPKSAAVECLEAYRGEAVFCACTTLPMVVSWKKSIWGSGRLGQVDTTPAFLRLRYGRSVS